MKASYRRHMTICRHLEIVTKLACILLCLLHCYRAPGQVGPSVQLPLDRVLFATFTDIKPTLWVGGDTQVLGYTFGGYIQAPRRFGFELRGSVLQSGVLPQEGARGGPRAAWHHGPFTTYSAVLAGITNSWEWRVPGLRPLFGRRERASPDLTILGGVDLHVGPRFSLRLGEASYTRIHKRDVDLNTLSLSTGVVYRLPWK